MSYVQVETRARPAFAIDALVRSLSACGVSASFPAELVDFDGADARSSRRREAEWASPG